MQTERVEFTAVYGEAYCQVLQVDGVTILLDCGWTEAFNPELLEPLRPIAPTVNLVLITCPDIEHIGALPYAVKHFGLEAKILLTRAAADLGVLCLYDTFIAKSRTTKFDHFDLDAIDRMRMQFEELNLEQTVHIDGSSLEVSVLRAGRMLGAGMWHIKREPEDILYAVDFNHKKEKHLDGAAFGKGLKPTVLITDAYNVNVRHLPRPKREEQLLEKILSHLRANGNVLLPVDSSGRVLELLMFLEQEWKKRKLTYPIVWVNNIADSIIRHVQSHLEFMEDGLNQEFSQTRVNPFAFKHVKLVDSLQAVHETRDPKIVLCASGSLEHGFSRQLLVQYAQHKRNLVLLTDRSTLESSLGRKLFEHCKNNTDWPFTTLSVNKWEYFQGDELETWKQQESERGAAELRLKKQLEEAKALREELAGGEDELEFDLDAEKELNVGDKRATDLEIQPISKSRKLMFSAPESERFARWDDYGQEIDENDYISANAKKAGDAQTDKSQVLEDISDLTTYDYGDPLRDCNLKEELRLRLPRRVKSEEVVVYFNCDFEYIDFEGRSDWRSIKIMIEKLKPRKVIVANSSKEKAEIFAEDMAYMEGLQCIVSTVGKTENIASDSGLWRVKMDRSLFDPALNPLYDSSLDRTLSIKNYDIAYIDGVVRDLSSSGRDYVLLEPLPLEEDGSSWHERTRSLPQTLLSVGELSLLTVQEKIAKAGYSSKFKEGVLLCDNDINIFKTKNTIQVKGPLCKEYFEIRKVIYDKLLLV